MLVLGLLAAGLCVAATLVALHRLLSGVPSGSGGIGMVAGGFLNLKTAFGGALLLVGVGLLLFAARRGGRLK